MLTRSASYPDREIAQWATQQVVTANEQVIHRCLAQNTRARLTVEAAWPSHEERPPHAGGWQDQGSPDSGARYATDWKATGCSPSPQGNWPVKGSQMRARATHWPQAVRQRP
ncbi:hypothetical protein ACWD7T_09620 [Streptomyces sp. 900116325]|uniref:Uncharacterized protein n=1 Tax=Streptomyces sp. 900116325 TaxID=3154295 RepID=A0ABV2UI51_9ACTN